MITSELDVSIEVPLLDLLALLESHGLELLSYTKLKNSNHSCTVRGPIAALAALRAEVL